MCSPLASGVRGPGRRKRAPTQLQQLQQLPWLQSMLAHLHRLHQRLPPRPHPHHHAQVSTFQARPQPGMMATMMVLPSRQLQQLRHQLRRRH